MSKQKPPEPDYLSVYDFASRKGVLPQAVYYRCKVKKDIEYIKIGKRKFIDWNKFSHIEFPHSAFYQDQSLIPSENVSTETGVPLD